MVLKLEKTIARAAGEFLTPTTLELGGKSPCVVDKNADIEVAQDVWLGQIFKRWTNLCSTRLFIVARRCERKIL